MTLGNAQAKTAFIRGSLFKSYQDYCPLVTVDAHPQPNGKWLVDFWGGESVEVEETELLDTAGFLIVQLGSIEQDYTLEVAATAIYQSLHSLFAACDASVEIEKFRTTVEFSEFMKMYRFKYSHVILIGHGSSNGIEFLDKKNPVAGSELGGFLGADEHRNRIQIISLCCHSGCEKLSSALSSATSVTEVIAPHETFDLRWSVHFITGFYLAMYLSGKNVDEAVQQATENNDSLKMCIWRNGALSGACASEK